MAAFKSLLDDQCGTTNPLIQLSQIYTHTPQVIPNILAMNILGSISFVGWFEK